MYPQFYSQIYAQRSWLLILIIILAIWTIPWKGYALWKSAHRGDKIWFIVLLIVNTVGILEIFYIYLFSERKKSMSSKENNKTDIVS